MRSKLGPQSERPIRRASFHHIPPRGTIATALPSVGGAVSVWLDGSWLDGVVVETSVSEGEFRVDFDDEAEGEAWISASQQWRQLGPAFEAGAHEQVTTEPALNHLACAPSTTAPIATAPALEAASVESSVVAEQPAAEFELCTEDDEVERLVLDEFAQLVDATMRADGRGAEPLAETRALFQQLHDRVAASEAPVSSS